MASSTSNIGSTDRGQNQSESRKRGQEEELITDEVSGGSGGSRHARTLRSDVWDNFEKTRDEQGKEIAICNYYKKSLSALSANGTSNLRNHVKRCKAKGAESGQVASTQVGTPSFKSSKFNQEQSRRDVVEMIVKHEYSFSMVDHGYFRKFVHNLQPSFELRHRNTISSDIMKFYNEEKKELCKVFINLGSRVSLTMDLWTAQKTRDSYLCLTGHFIDEDWVLKKKILNFELMESDHSGEEMGKVVIKCLYDWNLDKKVSTITLDNASANDLIVGRLKAILSPLHFSGEFFHIRCATHILNLIVKDGLVSIGDVLTKVRDSCKYVRTNSQRKMKWKVAVDQVRDKIVSNKEVCLDCPTRWNSTYDMLKVALEYREAFMRLAIREDDFKTNPSREEWEMATTVCDCLKVFYDATKHLSGVPYPTADLYFEDMCEIHIFLNKWVESDNLLVKNMAKSMMKKFKKYWGTCNMTLAVAYVLNPGLKMKFVHNYYTEIYGEFVGTSYTKMVSNSLASLYNRYAPPKPTTVLATQSSVTCSVGDSSKDIRLSRSLRHASWYEREGLGSADTKSELDIYLEETLDTHVGSLLVWWRANSLKYPTLSKMARDILAIPVSSVPSESAFSTGGRVLTEQRASLSPRMVEALICTQDWLPSLDSSPPCSTSEPTEAYVADDEETYDAEKHDDDDYNLVSLDQFESPKL